MIIENLDALKSWLSKTLEPICDADPSALAKYVVALVKKDKTQKELKALCNDQLDVFLQKETQTFVDKLFEAVNTKSYLPQPPQDQLLNRTDTHMRPDKEELKKEEERKKFSRRVNHSPPPNSRYGRDCRRGEDRKKDDRSRKREYERNPPRRDSYRDRYNRRRGRSRSYSRSRSRSWSKDRQRERDRERDREQRDSGKPKYDHDRSERQEVGPGEPYTSTPLATGTSSPHFPVPTLSSTITVIAPAHHGNSTTESWSEFHQDHSLDHSPYVRTGPPPPRKRCRDYDEKGFCMRGDMCPFDHGSDPVVVEDVNLPSILPFQPPPLPVVDGPPPPGLPPPPPLLTPPVNLIPPVPPPGSLPPSLQNGYIPTGPPPPLPALQPSGMDAPPNSITSSVPSIVTSGVRPPLSQPPPPLFTSGPDVYNPEAPSMSGPLRPVFRHRVNAQRPNLIACSIKFTNIYSRKRLGGPRDVCIPQKKPWFDKPNFSKPNHQGFQKKVPFGFPNTKLAVRQIPSELNNISKLNEHFSKFGTIVNLQVAYGNDPESALIQFATYEEAKRAIQSTEAVLNNRFIKVHWHRDNAMGQTHMPANTVPTTFPNIQPAQQPAVTTLKQSVKDRLGPLPAGNSEPAQGPVVNASKVSVKERLGFSAGASPGGKVFSTSTGLTKTVYNPSAFKPAQKGAPFMATTSPEEALKKKQEALKLQQDVRKKKQEILEKHIETQKLLISKLEKNKTMKPEDKAQIMETLSSLTKSITKLQEEIKGISSASVLRTVKSKAQAQKELLDTELDLYKKTQAGEDTAQLKIKYTQLQLEAAKRGILAPGRGRAANARGRGTLRGRGRGMRGRGRGLLVHAVVDHRPRSLEISGFSEADRVDLLPHFAQFGEIEDCRMEDNSLSAIITYKTRAEAELAALRGLHLNNQDLRLAWHKPAIPLSLPDTDEVEPEEEEYQEESLVDDLLQDDDEDDDHESRPWRR
uniref:RNA-binding protein 26 n=1 Tax=Denticeps clupeoides TaxID=299321 RepID=A0AAY4DS12_9TELE